VILFQHNRLLDPKHLFHFIGCLYLILLRIIGTFEHLNHTYIYFVCLNLQENELC
jgi:hypothetical protein